jgi:hypothetical protein
MEGRSDPKKGARPKIGSGVGCLGSIGKLKHDVAPENCALPQKIALILSRATESSGVLSMTLPP